MISVGEPAPDFELSDQHGARVRLSALRGRPVLLVFFPFAFTAVCTDELAALRDHVVPAVGGEAAVLAVSCDTMVGLRVFGDQNGLDFPLLSDFWPHGRVASSYGVFDDDRGCALRGTFVVDAAGDVRWTVTHALPEARDVAAYRRVLADLGAA
ncbi:peroxiredoxin [Haloactinopolyspora alba]|uniref:Alkyl hydroperoxide reductase E n=1 Tax=Haloactinopolyspora alba TaxID=648780 RepID=A0A2P8E016_9ACTN|nr:peroxiredoxin [Haloactinopolyspora alba]PSL02800.1 peroxiredoxin [Haloactinopolyspora alba]